MTREEKIMKRLQEHYDYLEAKGFKIVFLALQRKSKLWTRYL